MRMKMRDGEYGIGRVSEMTPGQPAPFQAANREAL